MASSLLDFTLMQPLLRRAGRDRIMERLTLAERTLLANVRQMDRYRRGFYVEIMTGVDAGSGPSRRGGVFGAGLEGFTGVGGGFTERNTHDNYNQVSAYEIGHIPYSMDGPICHCGARGCIETQLGEDILVKDLDKVSVLKKLPDINEEYLENREVQKVLENKGRLLYMTLRSVYQAVFPDTILLISRSLALSKYLAGLLEREAEQDKLLRFRVLAESYDPALYSRGAADLVWENYFI